MWEQCFSSTVYPGFINIITRHNIIKKRILASSSPEATTLFADLSHINNSKNGLPSCTSDTFRDIQVQVLCLTLNLSLFFSCQYDHPSSCSPTHLCGRSIQCFEQQHNNNIMYLGGRPQASPRYAGDRSQPYSLEQGTIIFRCWSFHFSHLCCSNF